MFARFLWPSAMRGWRLGKQWPPPNPGLDPALMAMADAKMRVRYGKLCHEFGDTKGPFHLPKRNAVSGCPS